MATKSGLVFSATGEGDVIALDSNTGKALWHYMAGGNIADGPMSYSVDGRQYIAIGAGTCSTLSHFSREISEPC
jgi:alcohol dehydrogenase (cytochrome c)